MSAAVGVQVSVPDFWSAAGVNTALLPAGRPARLAVSEPIAWPSGSAAVTFTVIGRFRTTLAAAGAVTTGAWSASGSSTIEISSRNQISDALLGVSITRMFRLVPAVVTT